MDPKTISLAVFQKRAGGKNYTGSLAFEVSVVMTLIDIK